MTVIAEDRAGACYIKSLQKPIERVHTSPLYLFWLLTTAVVMVLLPLVYVGLIGLVAYGIYYHATVNIGILSSGSGMRGRVLVYVAPLVAGAVLLLFMVKPLFARSVGREKRVSLIRQNEPVLFEFVDRLCGVVGAPRPRRIDVDCEVNASASLRRGLLSLLGDDLVLTIGAPLVGGMTVRQFAGVLAHEFGHFAQGMGMRLSYVIHRVNIWFARVVYERDSWDEWLANSAEGNGGFVALTVMLSRLCVWLTRKVLWILMMIGQAVSCLMSRQMEYDADRFQARLSGSESFAESMRRIHVLDAAGRAAHAELWQSWQEGHLADNYPLLVALRADHCPPEVQKALDEWIAGGRTKLFDTHPSCAARIRKAKAEEAPGVFRDDGPASSLFRDFETLSKAVTCSYYQDLVGPEFKQSSLVPTAKLVSQSATIGRARKACERYCGGALLVERPLRLDPFSKVFQTPAEQLVPQLKRAAQAVAGAGSVIRQARKQYSEALEQLFKADRGLAAFKMHAKPQSVSAARIEPVKHARNTAAQDIEVAIPRLQKVEAAVSHRLLCALALLDAEQVASRIEQAGQWRSRRRLLLDALNSIAQISSQVAELRTLHLQLLSVGEALSGVEANESQVDQALRWLEDHQRVYDDIRAALRETRYPFDHAEGEVSVAKYAMPAISSRNDLGAALSAGGCTLENLDGLYLRIMGELAEMSEAVEAALGIKVAQADHTDPNQQVEVVR